MHQTRRELDTSGWRARVKAMAREVRYPPGGNTRGHGRARSRCSGRGMEVLCRPVWVGPLHCSFAAANAPSQLGRNGRLRLQAAQRGRDGETDPDAPPMTADELVAAVEQAAHGTFGSCRRRDVCVHARVGLLQVARSAGCIGSAWGVGGGRAGARSTMVTHHSPGLACDWGRRGAPVRADALPDSVMTAVVGETLAFVRRHAPPSSSSTRPSGGLHGV